MFDKTQSVSPFVFFLFYLLEQAGELGVGVRSEISWLVKFNDLAVGEHHYLVTLHDCVQSVRNRNQRALTELSLDQLLNLLLCHQVDVGSGLVQDNNLGVSKDGSADANKLLLS